MPAWLDALDRDAPVAVEAFRAFTYGAYIRVRRIVRRHAGEGAAERAPVELAALAAEMRRLVGGLPDEAFRAPGGEGDWNVAEAVGHVADARAGLCLAASLAATGRWPRDAPVVVPGVPGPPDAGRDDLLRRIDRSQRLIERSARAVAGHELDPCPLEHPLVGRLRCGEWLVYAGVHDLMHLEQLHRLAGAEALA